ncbi:hypothetical protein [Gimesia maris]|uniref:hypothetical protein n=1 Tax=Gimesia maris TaxID=122 RepID=UPI00241F623C|nr:hypothetical protein [Gimesia maris]|tara:strand:+ start:20270 stop:20539 length:270 start_codon:yes stop_codon:yes gene_type:complete
MKTNLKPPDQQQADRTMPVIVETSGAIVGWPDNAFVMACSTLKLQQFTPSHFVSFHIFRMLSFFVIAISNCRVPSVGLPDSACRTSPKD